VPSGSGASIQDLAIFAWREFVALNRVAMDPGTTGIRGRPNVNADFLNIKADKTKSFPAFVFASREQVDNRPPRRPGSEMGVDT
jgi:hypothetical protein